MYWYQDQQNLNTQQIEQNTVKHTKNLVAQSV